MVYRVAVRNDGRKSRGVSMPVRSGNLLNSIVFGIVTGIDGIAYSLALAVILFTEPFKTAAPLAFGAIMIGMIVYAIIIGQFSALKNAVGEVQEVSIGILVVALATMSAHLDHAATDEKTSTAFAIIGLSTIFSGLLLMIVGWFRIGTIVRFLPQPVIAGFLAGSGWILFVGSVELTTRVHLDFNMFSLITRHEVIGIIAPATILAILMHGVQHFYKNSFAIPSLLIGSVITFYAIYYAGYADLDIARQFGWIPEVTSAVHVAIPELSLIDHVNWTEVLNAVPFMASIALLTIISAMLKWTSLELALSADLDINRELAVSGIGNIVAGCFGSPTGFIGFRTTLMANQMGARDRRASLAVALVLILGLFYSQTLIAYTPTFFSAGLMLYGSALLIYQWAIQSRRQMVPTEWAITILIFLSIIVFGILYGIVIGLAISSLSFVYNYSKLPVVRNILGGHEMRSLVDRSQIETRYLVQNGRSIAILRLQGYLFFGTADGIVRSVRQILASGNSTPLRAILLDFSHVSGIDSAAAACFIKIRNLISAEKAKLFFCNLSLEVEAVLRRSGQSFDDQMTFLFPDVDHALEVCEDHLLKEYKNHFDSTSFENHIASILGQDERIPKLISAMERFDLGVGETLIRAGDVANDVYIVADGRIKVEIRLQDGKQLRLRSMTKGAIVGEIGHYLKQKRSADIVVEDRATLYRMSADKLEHLERNSPELASLFHKLIAISLSEKMVIANQLISRSKE